MTNGDCQGRISVSHPHTHDVFLYLRTGVHCNFEIVRNYYLCKLRVLSLLHSICIRKEVDFVILACKDRNYKFCVQPQCYYTFINVKTFVCWVIFFMILLWSKCCLLTCFKINCFKKFVQKHHQNVKLFRSRSTVCKGYQQTIRLR